MMPERVQPEKLTIQHVAQPGQRMPVALVECGKRPDNRIERYSCLHTRIAGHILEIIITDEVAGSNRLKSDDNRQNQGQANQKNVQFFRHE